MKIVFTGGGTGGHLFPLIDLSREIKRLILPAEEVLLTYVGPKDEWSSLYLEQEGVEIKPVLAGKLRRYFTPQAVILNFIDVFKFIIGTIQAIFWLFLKNPDLVFSKGGFGSMPVTIAAKMLLIPIFLHESDVSPGLSNRIAGRFAIEIFTSFPNTEYFNPQKMIIVGTPIRQELFGGSKQGGKEILKLTQERPILFITGGSQGAQRINELILLILPQLLREYEIIHQCGSHNFEQVASEAQAILKSEPRKYYHPFGFMSEEQMSEAYFNTDLLISRAGSASIFEAAALGKPSILIPLPEAAQNHQVKNAHAFAKNGAALVIEEANITPNFLLAEIKSLIRNPQTLQKMGEAAKNFSRPRASEVIANYLIEYLGL